MKFSLSSFLPYRLAFLAARVSRSYAEQYRARFGISVAEWRVMAHVHDAGAVSVRDLHLRADLEKSKASRAASRLEDRGLIRKETDERDKRLISLTLTKEGRAMMAEMIPLALSFEKDLLAKLSEEDRAALNRIITKLGA